MTEKNDKTIVPALLADDVPNAKRKVILIIVGGVAVTLGVFTLIYLAYKFQWSVPYYILLFACWISADIILWQLWESVAYRLTVTEKQIVVNLFCRKKVMSLDEIQTYEYKKDAAPFCRFRLTDKTKTLNIETQYADEMLEILRTKTHAVETNACDTTNSTNT